MPGRTLGDVLSIAKLRVGQEAYQLSGVAQSLDDYYTGAGEAAGQWLGAGAERLGLAGEVAADDLRAVLAGLAPGSGGLTPDGGTVRTHVRRVPGFDLTFKVPKSVSVLYAVTDDPRVQGAVIDAGESAVRATVAWLEREAIRVRRGSGDAAYLDDLAARDPAAADAARVRVVPGRGVAAATFRHRTSRAGDPLLHWHTLVANLVEGPDGRWSAFVHPELFRAARAAGELFQTVLRGELTQHLGVEWRPGRHVLEIAGVPQALCDWFSKRSREIESWLAATGTPGDAAGRQAAVLATRRGKPEREQERFDAAWKAEAIAAGWGPAQAEVLVASASARSIPGAGEVWRLPVETDGAVVDRAVDSEEWIGHVLRALTEHDSTFTRAQLVQAVAARIGEGATVATVERTVARVIGSDQVVPIGDEQTPRWTSLELLGVEQRLLDTAEQARSARRPVPSRVVGGVLRRFPSMGEDQEQAVRVLAGSWDGVSVLVGPAGTGKTFALDALRQVFDAAGYQVAGAAPSAKAAHELQDGARIVSSTMHRLVGSWERGFELPTARTVLVVDEAAMAGVRDLQRVVSGVVGAGGRVVLVGDYHQLPEVNAGGGFAALATDPRATLAALTVNRRQHQVWERAALAELRDGHVARAVGAYRSHGRVVVAEDRPAMIAAGVDRWLAAHTEGLVPVLLAGTNEIVTALNTAVRQALVDQGVLGPNLDGHAAALAIGERLMVRVNDYWAVTTARRRTAVLNGQTGTLVGATDAGVVVRMDHNDSDVVLPDGFVAAGGVEYAYASTAHRAQGGTWALAITVGLDGLYREAGYLVMSRGRASNWLVVTAPELEDVDTELARHDSPIPLPSEEPGAVDEELVGTLATSRRKLLALTHDPHAPAVHHAAATCELVMLEANAGHARWAEQQASRIIGADPDQLRDRLARTVHTAGHVAAGMRVKAWDRHNIGTVIAVDDATGEVQVQFVSVDGRTAVRTMGWGDVQIVTPRHPAPRTLTPVATATLERLTDTLARQVARWEQHLASHGVQPGDRHVYEHAARLVVDRAAANLAAAQPDWLVDLVGVRPPGPPAVVQVWDDTVHEIAAHRTRHGITDPTMPVGPDCIDPGTAAVWDAVSPAVAASRVWLDTHGTTPDLAVTRTRSRQELKVRRAELDAIFATVPPDHRGFIDRLQAGGMLPLEDTTDLLRQALTIQGRRRRWILEHWPHVVEYAQITRTLAHGLAGPDVPRLLTTLAASPYRQLAAAADAGEAWLVTLTGQLVAPDAASADPATERLLADVAGYRHRWAVTGATPLGEGTFDVDQAAERTVLTLAINHAAGDALLDLDDQWDVHPLESRLPELDDTLGR
ncbi:MAG: MobF family relaxase [Acidimicrobiales bacterium]